MDQLCRSCCFAHHALGITELKDDERLLVVIGCFPSLMIEQQ